MFWFYFVPLELSFIWDVQLEMRQRKFCKQNLWASLPLPQFRLSPSMVQPPCLEPKASTDWGGGAGRGVCLWIWRGTLLFGRLSKSNVQEKIQALAEKGGNSVFGLVAPPNPMCAGPLKGFVSVLSRLQISQAWIGARLSGCASEIQPARRPPWSSSTDSGAKHYCASDNHSKVKVPSSTDFFSIFGLHFQIERPRRPPARMWGRKKKLVWGHRSNVQGSLERGFWGGKVKSFGVVPLDPTSSAPSSADLGGQRSDLWGSHLQIQRPERPRARTWEGQKKVGGVTRGQIQRPERPRARIWGGKKKFFGTSPRSNAQGALERGFEGANSRFWGSHGQIQRPGRPSSADLGGQKKYFLEQAPDPTPRAPSSADLGGQTQDFGGRSSRSKVQGALERGFGGAKTILGLSLPDPTFTAPSSADMGWRANYPSCTAHWNRKKIFLNPSRQAPPKSNVQGALERGFGGATESFQSKFPNPTSYLPLCPPPKSKVQGALEHGFGGGATCPPQIQAEDWGLKIFFSVFWCLGA